MPTNENCCIISTNNAITSNINSEHNIALPVMAMCNGYYYIMGNCAWVERYWPIEEQVTSICAFAVLAITANCVLHALR